MSKQSKASLNSTLQNVLWSLRSKSCLSLYRSRRLWKRVMRMRVQLGEEKRLRTNSDLKQSKRRISTVGFLTARIVRMKMLLKTPLFMNQIRQSFQEAIRARRLERDHPLQVKHLMLNQTLHSKPPMARL